MLFPPTKKLLEVQHKKIIFACHASLLEGHTASTAFVKVKNPLTTQSAILHLKLIRKDGATLNCYYPDTKMLHQTMQWFLES
jgi:hypothetical protein